MTNPEKLFGRLGNKMFQMAYIYAQVKEGKLPDIYCQDPDLFEKYKEEIRQWYGEGIGYIPQVGIHLRRGDYVNNPFYCSLWETGYYIDACNLFPDRTFIVFSDDIEFAKIYFTGDKFAFDQSLDDLEAFNKFASCDGKIIANSSWSWWGAYLSQNTGKIVAPTADKWYSSGKELTKCVKEWTRI